LSRASSLWRPTLTAVTTNSAIDMPDLRTGDGYYVLTHLCTVSVPPACRDLGLADYERRVIGGSDLDKLDPDHLVSQAAQPQWAD
jgi:hypothetical protein